MQIKSKICISLSICFIYIVFTASSSLSYDSLAEMYYYEAAECYKDLKKYPEKQKFRDEWLKCIESSEKVYQNDLDGRWATAGLYQTGQLYYKLYKKSFNDEHLKKAEENFIRLLKKFPQSQYRTRTVNVLQEMQSNFPQKTDFNAVCMSPKKKSIVDQEKDNQAREKYFEGEYCFKKLQDLQNTSEKHWISCIKKFYDVYQFDNEGRWAAAGLFQAGNLFGQLYDFTADNRHYLKCENYLQQTVKLYPESKYCQKSSHLLKDIYLKYPDKRLVKHSSTLTSKKIRPVKPTPKDLEKNISVRDKYFKAESCYKNLIRTNSKKEDQWRSCIDSFLGVYNFDPKGKWAAAGLYRAGRLYQESYKLFGKPQYISNAEMCFKRILISFPGSDYVEKTNKILKKFEDFKQQYSEDAKKTSNVKANLSQDKISQKKSDEKPNIKSDIKSDIKPDIQKEIERLIEQKQEKNANPRGTLIKNLTLETNKSRSRITLHLDRDVNYTHFIEEAFFNNFKKLHIQFSSAQMTKKALSNLSLHDGLISKIKYNYYDSNANLIFHIDKQSTYKVFTLKSPERFILDIHSADASKPTKNLKKKNNQNNGAIAKQFALGVKKIIIDAGHGGKDGGAKGFIEGVYEKEVTLAIALKLAKKIKRQLNCQVLLTRDTDVFLTLEERTEIANKSKGDLFISIHTNAHYDSSIFGVESYYLNLATDDDAIRVAARENAISGKKLSDLDAILHDLMQNSKIVESSHLAGYVQNSIYSNLKKRYSNLSNHGVKKAPFYVLM